MPPPSYDYVITLQRKSHRGINLVGFLLYLFAIVFFLQFLIGVRSLPLADVVSVTLMALLLIWKWMENKRKSSIYLRGGLVIASIAICTLHPPFWYLALLYLAAAFLESYAKTPLEIGFGQNGIVVNSLPRRSYAWSNIRNIVLKDELLTIDLNNNRLIQQPTEPYSNELEQEFNDFCSSKLPNQGQ